MSPIRLLVLALLSCVLWLVHETVVTADTPLPPPAKKEIWSGNHFYCAVMDPASNLTIVYHVRDGKRTKLWSMLGWFRVAYLLSGRRRASGRRPQRRQSSAPERPRRRHHGLFRPQGRSHSHADAPRSCQIEGCHEAEPLRTTTGANIWALTRTGCSASKRSTTPGCSSTPERASSNVRQPFRPHRLRRTRPNIASRDNPSPDGYTVGIAIRRPPTPPRLAVSAAMALERRSSAMDKVKDHFRTTASPPPTASSLSRSGPATP